MLARMKSRTRRCHKRSNSCQRLACARDLFTQLSSTGRQRIPVPAVLL